MAYFFCDDGNPEAKDYEDNYFYFDGLDSKKVSYLSSLGSGEIPNDPIFKALVFGNSQTNLETKQQGSGCKYSINMQSINFVVIPLHVIGSIFKRFSALSKGFFCVSKYK